jgi:RNA polymerase sigma factor (sigma-70 family)
MNIDFEVSLQATRLDEIVWSDFKTGDREAFALLYRRYFIILKHYGSRISDDKDLVKDCIHDLFVEMWNNKMNLAVPQSVRAYLLSSIQRKVVRSLKRCEKVAQAAHVMLEEEFVDSKEAELITDQIDKEKQNSIARAMNSLTKRQQEAIYLKFYTDLTYSEISCVMKISADSIYNLVSKAIDVLQEDFPGGRNRASSGSR